MRIVALSMRLDWIFEISSVVLPGMVACDSWGVAGSEMSGGGIKFMKLSCESIALPAR